VAYENKATEIFSVMFHVIHDLSLSQAFFILGFKLKGIATPLPPTKMFSSQRIGKKMAEPHEDS
jgi:hypothetical protein